MIGNISEFPQLRASSYFSQFTSLGLFSWMPRQHQWLNRLSVPLPGLLSAKSWTSPQLSMSPQHTIIGANFEAHLEDWELGLA